MLECTSASFLEARESWRLELVSVHKKIQDKQIIFRLARFHSRIATFFCSVYSFPGNPTIVLEFVDLVFTDSTFISYYGTHKPLQSGDIPSGTELQWYKDGVQQTLQSGLLVLGNHAKPSQAGEYTAKLVHNNNETLVSETMTITINSELITCVCQVAILAT